MMKRTKSIILVLFSAMAIESSMAGDPPPREVLDVMLQRDRKISAINEEAETSLRRLLTHYKKTKDATTVSQIEDMLASIASKPQKNEEQIIGTWIFTSKKWRKTRTFKNRLFTRYA